MQTGDKVVLTGTVIGLNTDFNWANVRVGDAVVCVPMDQLWRRP